MAIGERFRLLIPTLDDPVALCVDEPPARGSFDRRPSLVKGSRIPVHRRDHNLSLRINVAKGPEADVWRASTACDQEERKQVAR